MNPWRELWSDIRHEWRTGTPSLRLMVLLRTPVDVLRLLAASFEWRSGWASGLGGDFLHATRRLLRAPAYVLFSVVTLAVVLTAVPTVHAVLDFMLRKPAQLQAPERIVTVLGGTVRTPEQRAMNWHDFQALARAQRSLEGVSASSLMATAAVTPGGVVEAVGEAVTSDYFVVFRTDLRAGRPLLADDFLPSAAPAVVLAEHGARRWFGDAASALNRTVTLGGREFTVVGITRDGFVGGSAPFRPSDFWMPLEQARRSAPALPDALFDPSRRSYGWLRVNARLRDTTNMSQAGEEISSLGESLERQSPTHTESGSGRRWSLDADRDRELTIFRRMGAVILTALGLVVLLACTNLANLALSRAVWRRHELDTRRALGASRWRLVREQTLEPLFIIALATALAIPALSWALDALTMEVPIARGMYVWMEPTITPTVVIGIGVAAACCLLVAGVWPAFRVSAAGYLGTGVVQAARRLRLQRVLIVVQVTGSVALLMTTISLVNATTRNLPDSGVDLHHLGMARVDLLLTPRDDAQQVALRDGILARLRSQPSIEAAAVSDSLPFGLLPDQLSIAPSDSDRTSGAGMNTYLIRATPDFWRTLDIPILHGRAIDDDDVRMGRDVVVISRSNAVALFGNEQAVGRRVYATERVGTDQMRSEWEVVGVAGDVDTFTMGSRRTNLIVRPLTMPLGRPSALTITARADDPDMAVAAIRRAIRDTDADVMVKDAVTGWIGLAGPYVMGYGLAWMSALLGGVTLALVMSGLYGVLTTVVAQARREMAIRLALGATRAQLVRKVMIMGAQPAVIGLIAGLGTGMLFRIVVRSVLPSRELLSIVDPLGLTVVPAVIVAATWLATFVPARRAAGVDPNEVLRQE